MLFGCALDLVSGAIAMAKHRLLRPNKPFRSSAGEVCFPGYRQRSVLADAACAAVRTMNCIIGLVVAWAGWTVVYVDVPAMVLLR